MSQLAPTNRCRQDLLWRTPNSLMIMATTAVTGGCWDPQAAAGAQELFRIPAAKGARRQPGDKNSVPLGDPPFRLAQVAAKSPRHPSGYIVRNNVVIKHVTTSSSYSSSDRPYSIDSLNYAMILGLVYRIDCHVTFYRWKLSGLELTLLIRKPRAVSCV